MLTWIQPLGEIYSNTTIMLKKNRYVPSTIINCIIFCGAFEVALRGHDKTENSENPGVFRGLINFSADLDATLSEHLRNATVFKGCHA